VESRLRARSERGRGYEVSRGRWSYASCTTM